MDDALDPQPSLAPEDEMILRRATPPTVLRQTVPIVKFGDEADQELIDAVKAAVELSYKKKDNDEGMTLMTLGSGERALCVLRTQFLNTTTG